MPWLDAAWYDGGWIDADVVPFDPSDRGLLLGDGVFDTSLVLGGRMVWRSAHLDRLVRWCSEFGFAVQRERLECGVDEVSARLDRAVLRITVTRGPGARGLSPPVDARPTILVTSAPLPEQRLFAPTSAKTVGIRRNETSVLSTMKSLNYGDAILASKEAEQAGFKDALLLNTSGRVACLSIGNLFAVLGSRIVTPPLSDGAVDGVVRRFLLANSRQLGLDLLEASLSLADLHAADALFTTNSVRCVSQVQRHDARQYGISREVERIMNFVADAVARDAASRSDIFHRAIEGAKVEHPRI